MRTLNIQTPSLIKKIRGKNIKQDKKLKNMLFKNPKAKESASSLGNTLLKWFFWGLLLFIFFIFINLHYKIYDQVASILLPVNQNYNVGYINVSTEYAPAIASINNDKIGNTPIKEYELSPGNYTLHLETSLKVAPKASLDIPISVISSNATIVKANVGPSFRTSSYLVIYATPSLEPELLVFTYTPGAKVYINNQFIGNTPLEYANLPNASTFNLKITNAGYKPITAQIAVHPKTSIHIQAKLYQYVLTNLDN